ncbi:hypothetical protein ACQKJ1_27965 [Methylorubrum rhodesianum]|uniref:hypothetical protein n=1 Tax=Methylorubrum rhodesianum TaxID=29427 RepID=UPI003D045779
MAKALAYDGPPIVKGVRVKKIYDHIAGLDALPIGQRQSAQIGLKWALDGREEAAGSLMDYLGAEHAIGLIGVLVEANAPPSLLQEAIGSVVRHAHKRLPSLIVRIGGRQVFATWCRKAQFEMPTGLPEVVTVARGTHEVPHDVNAQGLHWSVGSPGSDAFDGAAFYAGGMPNALVVVAKVPRNALTYFLPGSLPYEVLLDDVPPTYDVVTDPVVIAEGALRFAYHRRTSSVQPRKRPFDPSANAFDRLAARLIAWDEARQRGGAGDDPGLYQMPDWSVAGS